MWVNVSKMTATQSQLPTAMTSYRNFDPDANVLLYIDNSNMFESAKKYSGHKKGFINETPDFLCRIDIGRLISKAVCGRDVLIGKLYGSEPPALDTGKCLENLSIFGKCFHKLFLKICYDLICV